MKKRLDKLLVEKGLASTRQRALPLIMEGRVIVNGSVITKPGTLIKEDSIIEIKGKEIPYVSRGGLKLEAAIKHFGISVKDKIAMDIGSSTGGFTDCLLKNGAKKVYCIDVGYGQLDWKLRQDSRVILYERTNIRYLDREKIPDKIDIATIDVSFISLLKVIPKVLEFLEDKGEIIALIKPQFEVGKAEVGKGGIVRDEKKRIETINKIKDGSEAFGLKTIGIMESPILGQKGNVEYFIYMIKDNFRL